MIVIIVCFKNKNDLILKISVKFLRFTDKRIKNERELSNYIEKRLIWFEQLRSHIAKVPPLDRADATRNTVREKVSLLLFFALVGDFLSFTVIEF